VFPFIDLIDLSRYLSGTRILGMSCCDWPWSRKEDVCVIFFASRGVFPEPCVEIISNQDRQFDAEKVYTWIEEQELEGFLHRLRFDEVTKAAIQRVGTLAIYKTLSI
jgi:hypothetical protein